MQGILLIAALIALAAWLYLLLGRGQFWKVRSVLPSQSVSVESRASIAVVIPARNEADVVGRTVASLLRQQGEHELHIFLVDDNSIDGTAQAALQAASAVSAADRVTIVAGKPLPKGWSGKLWAMQQGVDQALQRHPDFLLFTDADIEHSPHNLATLEGIALSGGYDLVSFMVKLHCRSLPERLLIPAFVFFFFMLYPPQWIRDPRRKTAGAAGGCMLVRPAALETAGGIAAIRQEIIDDCALARAIKHTGGTVWLGATDQTSSLRAYGSFGEIERMISRTAFNQLQHSIGLLIGAVLGMLLIYVLPIGSLMSGRAILMAVGAAGYLAMIATYVPMVRFYKLNLAWALTLPLAALFYTAATIHSAIKYWTGSGGEWKGRAQDNS